MAENSKIEWTDHTFNPWIGCTKVSPACDHCYAEAWDRRFAVSGHAMRWGAHAQRTRTSAANWRKPLQWNAQAAREGRRFRVFCASLADVFDNQVPAQWRISLLSLILQTPHLDWLLLSKRIGNAAEMLEQAFRAVHHGREGWVDNVPPNVWIGATVVNQAEANRDIPRLLNTPAAGRFLSVEPMLGYIDLSRACAGLMQDFAAMGGAYLHWVICGGESGPGARPMHLAWADDLRGQCHAAKVPFFFKQWGEWCPRGPETVGYPVVDGVPRLRMTDAGDNGQQLDAHGGYDVWMNRAGKKRAGRLLGGRTYDENPFVPAEEVTHGLP